jgi:hypothetical protein
VLTATLEKEKNRKMLYKKDNRGKRQHCQQIDKSIDIYIFSLVDIPSTPVNIVNAQVTPVYPLDLFDAAKKPPVRLLRTDLSFSWVEVVLLVAF